MPKISEMASNARFDRRINLFINGKEIRNNVQSIRAEMAKLINAQAKMTLGSREYVAAGRQIQQLNAILRQHRTDLENANRSWLSLTGMRDTINKYAGVVAGFAASFAGVVIGAKKANDAFVEYDEKLADVMKTTGMTKDQVKSLSAELAKMDTRTSQLELLDLARVAGKLGISSQKDIEGFVRATDQISVALKEDLGGNVEESVNQLGKLVDVFKLNDEFGIEQSLLKVGSAINSLGAAGTANEGYMVEFAKRVAGVAPMAGVSMSKVLGLGATLDELGQTAEVSGTTYTQVLGAMFKDTAKFAAVAKMDVGSFTKLLNTDANEAFIKVLEGARGTSGGFGELAQNLDGMGLDGARAVGVLGVLANNIDKLRDRQAYANDEFEKGSSLTDEYNVKQNTAQARAEKSKKEIADLAVQIGEKLNPYMTLANVGLAQFLRLLIGIPAFIKQNSTLLMMLAGAVLAYNGRLITATALKLKDKAVTIAMMAIEKGNLVLMSARVIGMKAYIAMTGNATMAQKRFMVQARAMGAAMSANPLGAIIMGLTLLVGALKLYDTYSAGAIAREKQKKTAVENLAAANNALKTTYDDLTSKIQHMNRLSNQEKKDLQDKVSLTLKQAEAELMLQQAKQQDIEKDNERLTTLQNAWLKTVKFMSKTSIVAVIPGVDKFVDKTEDKWKKENAAEAASVMNEGIGALKDQIKSLATTKADLNEVLNAEQIGDEIGDESIENLEEKLSKYQQALKGAKIGGEEYLRIQQKIAAVQQLMAKLTPDAVVTSGGRVSAGKTATVDESPEAKLAKEKEEKEQKLADAIIDIRKRLGLAAMSEQEQERARVMENYADLLQMAEQGSESEKQLKELQAGELLALDKKFEAEKIVAKKEAQAKLDEFWASQHEGEMTDFERNRAEKIAQYEAMLKLAEENGLTTTEQYQMLKQELDGVMASEEPRDLFGMTEADWESMFEKFEMAMQYLDQIGSIWGSMITITNNKEDKALRQYEKNTEAKKKALQKQLDSGAISQAEYDKKVAALDEDLEKRKIDIQRKQALREQKLALFTIALNTAQAVMRIWADTPKVDWGVGTGILTALAVTAGAAQAAAVLTAPMPEYADGGYTSGDKIYTGSNGNRFRAGEAGKEWIGNNNMLNNPYTGPIIAALESVQRGKAPASIFAGGINAPAYSEMAASVPQFANGGYTAKSTATSAAIINQQVDIAPLVAGFNAMAEETRQLRQYMSDPRNRQAYINETSLELRDKERNQRNSFGRIK